MLSTKREILRGAVALAAASVLRAQNAHAQPELISAGDLRADLATLNHAWTALHPGLYRYNTLGRIEALFDQAERWANRDRSLAQFYVALTRLSAELRCGHTFPNPANQGRLVRERLLELAPALPFAFRWLGGKMIVTAATANGGLEPGDRIVSLDGVRAGALRRTLMPMMRADGGNDAKRLALISIDPRDDTGVFDLYRRLVFGARADFCTIRFERDGRTRRLEAAMTDLTARRAALQRSSANEGWSFAIEEGVGRLTMLDWALYDSEWDWRSFLNASVDHLIDERARGLIVDIRGNEGGLDCGDVLLARLIERPLAPQPSRRLTRYRRAPTELEPMLDTWDPSFKDWGEAAIGPDAEGFYELRGRGEDEEGVAPQGRRYAGPIIVLTDAANSSATFQFAARVKDNRLGAIMGEATGGSRRGINGGAYFFFRLPNSRIELDLPLIGYFPTTPQPDEGIIPDLAITPSRDDLRAGRDVVLQAARARLLNG